MSDTEVRTVIGQLQALTAKVDHISEVVNRIAYGEEGTPRCAGRLARINRMEQDIELCHTRISGVKKWMVAALAAAAGMLVNFAWDIIRSAARQ